MRPTSRLHPLLPLVVAGLTLLAACGSAGRTTNQGASITPSASLNGCPTQLIPVDPPIHPPDVILTQSSDPGTFVKSVTVTQGESIEIRLPANIRWHLQASDPSQALAVGRPSGWYNSQLLACIWRYSAVGAGQANLDFSGGPVCAADAPCPTIAAVAHYSVTVK